MTLTESSQAETHFYRLHENLGGSSVLKGGSVRFLQARPYLHNECFAKKDASKAFGVKFLDFVC